MENQEGDFLCSLLDGGCPTTTRVAHSIDPNLVTLSPDGGVTWRAAGGMIDLTLFVDQNVNRKMLKRLRHGSTDRWLPKWLIKSWTNEFGGP